AEDAVPDFEMSPRVPGHGGDPVTHLDAVPLQPLRDLKRPGANLRVVRRVHWSFDRTRDDGAIAMLDRGMVDDAMAQQRPILHQAKHQHFSLWTVLVTSVFAEWMQQPSSRTGPIGSG